MSFRLKTIFGIALIELTVMAILIGINQFALGGSATAQLYQRAEASARQFSNAVADAVIATDLATLDSTIETAVTSEELTYIRIRNPSGVVLSEGGSNEALTVPFVRDASFESARADHRIDIDVPIMVEGMLFGRIELGLSTLTVEDELAMALRWNVIVAMLGMSLVAVFGYGLGSILTRQLSGLREGATAITEGELDHQIRVRGRDELAQTAQCFNEMARTLAQDRKVLQDQRNELLAKKERVEVIVDCMSKISKGLETAEVPDTDRQDEIGSMARATVVFHNTMQAVELARIEQQRLITAFDQVAEQVAIFGINGQVLFLNKAFTAFHEPILSKLTSNFTLAEFFRQGLRDGAFLGIESDHETWIDEQIGRPSSTPEELRMAPDRFFLTVQSRVEGVGVVFSAKDITELRQSELQLVQASKMATLGEMATGVAHELNQPLGVIRLAASNCTKRINKGMYDQEFILKKLAKMGEQTERASQIINHMRIFGRKAEGKPMPFDLCDAMNEVATLARAQLQTLDISLKVNVPPGPAMVLGEKVIFEQVLLNLVSNARDAIESHGSSNGEIRFEADFGTPEGHIVRVRDTGGGVPEEILDKLFDPFFTTKEPGKGTGLGLSISFGTIRDMAGSISVTNDASGACFSIQMPDAEAGDILAESA